MIMKKTYNHPAMDVVKMEVSQMLAASGPEVSNNDYNGTDEVLSRDLLEITEFE